MILRSALESWWEAPRDWHHCGLLSWLPPGRPLDEDWWFFDSPEAVLRLGANIRAGIKLQSPTLWRLWLARRGVVSSVVGQQWPTVIEVRVGGCY